MVLCSSTHQSLMLLAGTEASLMVSRIPHTFIFRVVKYNLKNSQFISFNKLFCSKKTCQFRPRRGFPHLKSITQVSTEPEQLFPQGFAKKEYICAVAVCMKHFGFINLPLLRVYILKKVFILV